MIVCENTLMFVLEIGMIESEMRMIVFEFETEVVGSYVVVLEMKMCMFGMKMIAFEMRMIELECGKEVVAFRRNIRVLGIEVFVADLIGMKMIAFEMRMFVLGMFVFGMRDTEIGMKGKSKLKSRGPLTLPWLSSTHYQRIASIVHPFPLEILQQCAAVEMVYQDDQLSLLSEKDSRYAC